MKTKVMNLKLMTFACALFLTSAIFSQVNVSLNILPPYSPYFRDYMGYVSNNKSLVTLIYSNPSASGPIQVFLTGSIRKDDNSISVEVRDGFRSALPISLMPNIPKTLTGTQLREIFGNGNTNDLILKGITLTDVLNYQAMPEGNYSVCIRAKEYNSGALLSEDCRSMFIAYSEPPQITYPIANSTEYAKSPQYLNISWTPVTPFIQGLTYRLRMVKVPQGVSMHDALNYSTQVVLEKSNIPTTNYPIDLSSGIKLDTGSVYAIQVTGLSRNAFIKNEGKSEPIQFQYKPLPGWNYNTFVPTVENADLIFLNPKKMISGKTDTIKVNNENDMLVNWCWLKTVNADSSIIVDKNIIFAKNIQKYKLSIEKVKKVRSEKSSFVFNREFLKTDSTGLISNNLQLTDSQTLVAGFENKATYKATIKVIDFKNQVVETKVSPDFVFRRIADETTAFNIPVQAVISYNFKEYPEIYPVINSEVTIEAFKMQNSKSAANTQNPASGNLFSSLPAEAIDGVNYVKIASEVVTTDSIGKISAKFSIPAKYFDTDSVAYRIKIANPYFVDNDFEVIQIPVALKDSIVNFGNLVAKTYAYRLKLNVKKQFTKYNLVRSDDGLTVSLTENAHYSQSSANEVDDKEQSYTYEVGSNTIAEGIPVLLYRENKQGHIPSYEGIINKSNPPKKSLSKITIVGFGTTVRVKDSTFVTFERLLSTNTSGEEYQIIAINNLNEFIKKNNPVSYFNIEPNVGDKVTPGNSSTFGSILGGLTPSQNDMLGNAIENLDLKAPSTNFVDSGEFVAPKITFNLPLPDDTGNENDFYRTVSLNYEITSCTPPTSKLKGRLFYTWKSDLNNTKRPLANAHFRVIVDYVDGSGRSIGTTGNTSQMATKIGGHWEYTGFQATGSDEVVPLVDQYATMAEGTTDGDGFFSIDVVNINEKGNLGSGNVIHSEGSGKPPVADTDIDLDFQEEIESLINPGDANWGFEEDNFGNEAFGGVQNGLNGSFNVGFSKGTQSFEVKGGLKNGGVQAGGMMDIMHAPDEDKMHGPRPSTPVAPPTETTSESYSQFRRSFRIVIDGDKAGYFYPSIDVIDNIQPFQSMATPKDITLYVKEFKLAAKTFEDNSPLSAMQVTVFRDLNQKPKHLPAGEGDGKYAYKELISPEYTQPVNPKKFEHLWSALPVEEIAGKYGRDFTGLLQSEFNRYKVQSSSFVNTGSKTYASTLEEIPFFDDLTTDWTNPEIPVVDLDILLEPLTSRALVRVKDSASGQTLTKDRNTKVYVSKNQDLIYGSYSVKPVDKYGYAELIANQLPLKKYIKDPINSTSVWFGAVADGYKRSDIFYKAALKTMGEQTTPVLAVNPKGKIKGRVVNADMSQNSGGNIPGGVIPVGMLNGVPAYLQADSGKVFETDQFGNFEMEIAPKTGVVIKIIPKDVAWFDTTYVMSAVDATKELINLNSVNVYRRKHRLNFLVTSKVKIQNIEQTIRVKNATIQLGESKIITDQFGMAKMVFENVSVNNYTMIVRGPKGQGFIPKTVNLKSKESREFQQIDIELEKGSEITGIVKLDGNPVKNARVYLEVQNTSYSPPSTDFLNNAVQTGNPIGSQVQNGTIQALSGSNNNNYQVNANLNNTNQATGSITDDANLVEAYTDATGKYLLQGVPVNNQKINVIATLDTTFTVSGDKQQANIVNRNAITNLNLTLFNGPVINKLYGFPLTVEKITPVSQNQVKVTGLVHWTEAISDFKLKEDTKLLRVENVLFDIVNNNNQNKAVVNGNSVKIPGITNLKLSYIDKYNVKLSIASSFFNANSLYIIKDNDYGKITGKLQIVDNSFNYPSSYLSFTGSEFYFAKLNADSTLNSDISVSTSAFTETEANDVSFSKDDEFRKAITNKQTQYIQQTKPVYNLCDKNAEPIAFKIINFDATANPTKSYIDQAGRIHLNALLKCSIPNAQPENFSVTIPDLILDENKVYPASSSKPISISLEKWTLEARNWSFSTTEGGILSTDALIRTKIIDIPVGKFVLRSDMFFMDEFNMNKLGLAGGKFMLEGVDPTKAHLNYEYKVGSEMLPHWNFCLLGSGNSKVASLPALTGLPNYIIDLNYIEILSNDEMIVQLMQKDNKPDLLGNSVAKFEPLSIYNGPNYIGVTGLLNTGAPRMSDIGLTANWNNKNANPTFENVSTDFEGKGFVHFEAVKKKIEITNNLLTIEGRVMEKPDNTFNPLPATFYAHHSPVRGFKYHIDLKKDWITQLSEAESNDGNQPASSNKGYSLKIIEGGMKVQDNDWTTLKYEGWMMSNTKAKDDIADFKTKFEILGDVSANSDGLAVSGIDTPFGSMTQTFDFKKKELIGSLNISKPVMLGSVRLHGGVIETCFGSQGFYVAGGCSAFIPAGILAGDYNIGMMSGRYPLTDHLWGVTNSYIDEVVQNKCYKQSTQTLSGFYFAFNREIINKSIDFDFILASGYVKALALIGGDFYFNITANEWKLGGDGYVYAKVNAGLSAITGTSLSGSVMGEGKIMFQIGDPSYFNAVMKMDFTAQIKQSLVFTTISKSISVDCKTTAGTSGFSFSLGSGGSSLSCPPNE